MNHILIPTLSRAWTYATERTVKLPAISSEEDRHLAQFATTAFTFIATVCAVCGVVLTMFRHLISPPLLCIFAAAAAGSVAARSRHHISGLRLVSFALLACITLWSALALGSSSTLNSTFHSSHITVTLMSVMIPSLFLANRDVVVFGLFSCLCTMTLSFVPTTHNSVDITRDLLLPIASGVIFLCIASRLRDDVKIHNESRHKKLEDVVFEIRAARTAFAATLSHEFRSPLHGINGFAEMLVDDESLSDANREWANQIRTLVRVLLSVANQVLDSTRIENGKFLPNKEETNIRKITDDVVQICAVQSNKSVDLLCTVSCDVPELVLADATRIQQVIMNLVGNACKFTAQGEIVIRVSATDIPQTAEITEDRLMMQIDVEDSGAGMTPEQLLHLFVPYDVVDPVLSRRSAGAGLGLSISRSLCQLLGGDLICDKSVVSVGTVFRATIPVFGTLQTSTILPSSLHHGSRVAIASTRPVAMEIMFNTLSESGANCSQWIVPASVAASQTYLSWLMELLALQPHSKSADVLVLDIPTGIPVASTLSSQRSDMGFVVLAHSSELHGVGRHRSRGVRLLRKPTKTGELVKAVALSSLHHEFATSPFQRDSGLFSSRSSQLIIPACPISSINPQQQGQQQFCASPPALALILVVENDSQHATSSLVPCLQHLGVSVDHVRDPREAIAKLSSGGSYSAVMLGLPLINLTPEKTAMTIRELSVLHGKARLPVIALTPGFISDVTHKYLSYGMDDVVSKSLSLGELSDLLHRWISSPQS